LLSRKPDGPPLTVRCGSDSAWLTTILPRGAPGEHGAVNANSPLDGEAASCSRGQIHGGSGSYSAPSREVMLPGW